MPKLRDPKQVPIWRTICGKDLHSSEVPVLSAYDLAGLYMEYKHAYWANLEFPCKENSEKAKDLGRWMTMACFAIFRDDYRKTRENVKQSPV